VSARSLATAVLAICGILAAAGTAPADVIVNYAPVSSPTQNQPIPASSSAAGVTASTLAPTVPLQNFQGVGHPPLVGTVLNVAPINMAPPPTSIDNAFATSTSFSFTVTPPPGKVLDLSSLTFLVAAGGSTGTRETGVRSSLTGSTDLLTTPALGTSFSSETLNLASNPLFQDVTGPVTFTFAVFTPSGNQTLEFQNIQLNGTVTNPPPVPEPASMALWLSLGVFGVRSGWRRWRNRRAAA
jgi:hypothetical protein